MDDCAKYFQSDDATVAIAEEQASKSWLNDANETVSIHSFISSIYVAPLKDNYSEALAAQTPAENNSLCLLLFCCEALQLYTFT